MNLHLAQISALPFRNAVREPKDAAGILGIDLSRPVASRALGRRVARFLAWLGAAPRRARERAELARLSERELADMGLTRGDIGRIHDPAFTADHAAGRGG